jgi:hypothetical protein
MNEPNSNNKMNDDNNNNNMEIAWDDASVSFVVC